LRTNRHHDETQAIQGDGALPAVCAHESVVPSAANTPSVLARLLAELAALPPEQRAALAALLAPPQQPATPKPTAPTDCLPWEQREVDAT